MNKNRFVSIIINNYNYGRFLAASIESAISQTYPHKEVIVVDDGSTDDSEEIIKSYGSCIVAIFKKNGGQASAFNEGFKISKGEILIFLDSDDFLLPCALEKVIEIWQPLYAKVHYRLRTVDMNEQPIGIHPSRRAKLSGDDTLTTLLSKSSYITSVTSGNAFNRLALEKIFPVPETEFKIAADGYLNTIIPLYGKVKAVDEILGVYRIHGKNLWAFSGQRNILETIKVMIEHEIKTHHFLAKEAEKSGYFVSENSLFENYKFIKLKLLFLGLNADGQQPNAGKRLTFALIGIRCLLKYSFEMSLFGMIELATKLLLLGLMPAPLVRLLHKKLL